MENEPTEIAEDGDPNQTQESPESGGGAPPRSSEKATVKGRNNFAHERVGNFELTTLLGQGAFGSVYKGRDTNLGRDVAIKFLHNPLDAKRQKLFEREARALAALSKEAAIVGVYQWGEHLGQNYIVLEFVEGSTEQLLKAASQGVALSVALGIAADCAEALEAAHKQGILHRDIKPANILIEPATGQAKVADFGLARLEDDSEFTLAGGISGSPPYMSPEQASGSELDGRSDIFSLGVTLYELLSGERPFAGDTATQTMEHIRRNTRTLLKVRRPDLSDDICAMVEKATAHKPADRYQSAGDFARELRSTIASLERSGQAVTRSVHVDRPKVFRQHLNNVLAAAVIAVLSVVVLKFALFGGGTRIMDNPGVVFAEAKDKVSAGELDEALALLQALKSHGMEGNEYVINAYISYIEKQTEPEVSDTISEQAQELGEKIRAQQLDGPAPDQWTSRPLSYFLGETSFNNSQYVVSNELIPVFDLALDDVFKYNTSVTYVDRKNLAEILAEQSYSADLSTNERALQLGQLIGARLLVSGNFLKLTPNSPEKFNLEITDIETSQYIPAPRIDVDTYASDTPNTPPDVDGFLRAIADSFDEAVRQGYPLQGRLYLKDGVPAINIGLSVGVKEGQRFDLRPEKGGRPLEGMSVVVAGPPGQDFSPVELEGIGTENIPDSEDEGWYVRVVQVAEST